MAATFSLPATLSPPLTGRAAVTDALYRSLTAFDTNNSDLFDSSFMPNGVFQINDRPLKGLPEIHATGLPIIFRIITTHVAANLRIHMTYENGGNDNLEDDATKASLTATVFVQHFAKGMELDAPGLMSGSLYGGELVKDVDGLWKFTHLGIKALWVDGDWGVVGGNFSEMDS